MKPKYEKNDIAYQDDAWFENEKRNIFDIRNQHRELMSQKYYQVSDTTQILILKLPSDQICWQTLQD